MSFLFGYKKLLTWAGKKKPQEWAAVAQRFVDGDHRHHAVLAVTDALAGQHDGVAVVAVHNLVGVAVGDVIAHDGHGVAVFPYRQLQQLHFRRCHGVGVVTVGPSVLIINFLFHCKINHFILIIKFFAKIFS